MSIQRIACATLLLGAIGCGISQAKLNEAKASVQEGLEVWKKGGKPADLKSLAKPIEFNEGAWAAGDTLVSYEMGSTSYSDRDKVIRCEVRLTTKRKVKGKEKTDTVTVFYDVTLGSPIKVMNNPMP